MSDYTILPEHQLKHLTSEGRRQLFCWIHDEGIHYSQFHTADGSIHLEVDGYGFKRFDCNETFADVQRFIKILKHATANQLSWCDAEKTFSGNRIGKQTAIQEGVVEEIVKSLSVDQLIKQRDEALQQLQVVKGELESETKWAATYKRERDEAMKDRNAALSDRDAWARLCGAVDCYTPSTAEPYEALKLQRDELRAEVERAEAKTAAEYEAHKLTKCERDALKAEVERLKAEKENKKVFKSDRAEDSNAPEDGVTLKTLCTNCLKPIECKWPKETTFGGEKCTAEEYLGKALKSGNVYICCDNCLEKMPDVKVEDLREKGESK